MIPAEPTPQEYGRLQALRRYQILDTGPEGALDDLVKLAAQICGTPIALISLVDENRQWFKAKLGLEVSETPRAISFCGHAVHQTGLFLVPDATRDERFADNPLVTGPDQIQFYAGAPLVDPETHAIGALCVMDHVPRKMTADQQQALMVLARQVMTYLELHLYARELRASEEQLRQIAQATQRLAAIVEFSDDAIIGKDLDGTITSWNRGAEKLFGYAAEEMVGTPITRLIPSDRRDEETLILTKIRSGESVEHFETVRRAKSGRLIEVSVTASPIKDRSGRPIGVSKVARDITERRRSQQRLRLLDTCIGRLNDIVLVTEADPIAEPGPRIIFANRAFQTITGYTVEDAIGQSPRFLQGPKTDRKTLDEIRDALRNHKPIRRQLLNYGKEGTEYWLDIDLMPVFDPAGDCTHFVAIERDITDERRTRDQLLWKTAFFEAQVNSSLDGIMVVDRDGNKILQNHRMTEMWNIPAEVAANSNSLLQREWVTLQIRDAKPFTERAEYLHTHPDEISRDELVLLDGRIFDRYSAPVQSAEGKYYGRIWSFRDITERKRSEAARSASEARYRALFEHAPDGIAIVDSRGCYLDANLSLCRMMGYSREELIGLNAADLVAKDQAAQVAPTIAAIHSGQAYHSEWRFRRKDSSEFSAEIVATELPDGNVLAMIRDVTSRKQAQAQIAEQAALLDKARDAILVRELDGKITFWNESAERIYGWTRSEAIGHNVAELLYANAEKFAEINRRTVAEGEWHGEVQHVTKDRKELMIEARWTLIRDAEGRPTSVLAINTDITERKKLEAQFLRAQRMESIGTLAGGIAHDLNNILAPIMMSIELLKLGATDDSTRQILSTIDISAKRGADIVRQVLSFARGLDSALVKVETRTLLRDLESIIGDTFPKDIRLQFPSAQAGWPVLGDPTQLHQVLLNLAVNARDAMPQGGTLSVATENLVLDDQYAAMNLKAKPGRYVQINVTDSGTGIPPAIIEKIFDPFFTTKDVNKGTGLGLSTVMAIVKSHSGIINVYSEPGRGTTFKIYIPAYPDDASGVRSADEAINLPRGNGETILVADDEASILTITSQTLEAFGYRVLTAADGAQAVAVYAVNQARIAAVVTDMMMPIMDGAATIRALKRINPGVKIIAASGLNANGGTAHAADSSLKHFLVKPYTAGALLTVLRSILSDD